MYTTKPVAAITHVLDIGRIVEHLDKIPEDGVGNEAFNDGEKTRYAYEIATVVELDDPVRLDAMEDSSVTSPQSARYTDEVTSLGLPL